MDGFLLFILVFVGLVVATILIHNDDLDLPGL